MRTLSTFLFLLFFLACDGPADNVLGTGDGGNGNGSEDSDGGGDGGDSDATPDAGTPEDAAPPPRDAEPDGSPAADGGREVPSGFQLRKARLQWTVGPAGRGEQSMEFNGPGYRLRGRLRR